MFLVDIITNTELWKTNHWARQLDKNGLGNL